MSCPPWQSTCDSRQGTSNTRSTWGTPRATPGSVPRAGWTGRGSGRRSPRRERICDFCHRDLRSKWHSPWKLVMLVLTQHLAAALMNVIIREGVPTVSHMEAVIFLTNIKSSVCYKYALTGVKNTPYRSVAPQESDIWSRAKNVRWNTLHSDNSSPHFWQHKCCCC